MRASFCCTSASSSKPTRLGWGSFTYTFSRIFASASSPRVRFAAGVRDLGYALNQFFPVLGVECNSSAIQASLLFHILSKKHGFSASFVQSSIWIRYSLPLLCLRMDGSSQPHPPPELLRTYPIFFPMSVEVTGNGILGATADEGQQDVPAQRLM